MMNNGFLKQSTASQSRLVGPFVDDTDFKTLETGLTIANTDVKLSKNGAAGANKNSGGGTHRNNGMYSLTFDATDTDTVGELAGSILISGALVVVFKFTVLEEAIYDDLFGSGATGFLKPTTAGRTLDVTAGGTAGIDWANVENPSSAVDLSGTDIQLCDTITTYTGNTVQTGDSFARLGAPAGASVSADIADLPTVAEFEARTLVAASYFDVTSDLVDLSIGALASINSQVDTALADIGLDHLVAAAVIGTDVTDNSIIAKLVSKSATADWDSFSNTTDSLEAHRDETASSFTSNAAAVATAQADLDTLTGADGAILASSQPNYAPLLASSAPSNWGSLVISAGGIVNSNLEQISGSAVTETSSGRIAGNFNTFYDNADAATTKTLDDVGSGGGGGGDATEAKQDQIITLIGSGTVTTSSPVDPNTNEIEIIRGATYDGVAKAKLAWTVTKDYTGWAATLTIRHRTTRAVLLQKTITVASSTLLEASLTTTDTAFSALTTEDEFGHHPYDIELVSGSNTDKVGPHMANIVRDAKTQ